MAVTNRGTVLVAVAAAIICASGLSGQAVTPVSRANSVSFYPIAELTKDDTVQPSLRGARVADPKDWPASFYSLHPGGSCTSTLVGPRAMLTAAHCVPNNGTAQVRLAGHVYNGTCTQSSKYQSGDISADWAVCLMNSDVPVDLYETVNGDSALLKKGTEVLLTGFGCTDEMGGGGNDGIYRVGESKIDKLPSSQGNDIETVGEVALCFGDSGGGAFLFLDPQKKQRVQISVNSRIQTLDNGKLGQRSFLSSVSTTDARNFLSGWAATNNAAICGLTAGSSKCR